MSFDSATKKRVIESAQRIYWAYLSLEFANNSGKNTLENQINEAILAGNFNPTLKLNDLDMPAKIIEKMDATNNKTYELEFLGSNTFPAITPIQKYTTEQQKNVLLNHKYTVSRNAADNKYKLSTTIQYNDGSHTIGGPDKFDLWKMHIANLGIMIHELETNPKPASILAALATGSGKTFTQAIWMFVLITAKVKSIFTAPQELILQLFVELKHILPQSLLDQIEFKPDTTNEEKNNEVKQEADTATKTPLVSIMSDDNLFDNHWNLIANDPSIFLAFDEAHRINKTEGRTIKFKEAAEKHPSMLLTATPPELCYDLAGKKALLTLSRWQKTEQGYAVPTENQYIQVRPAADMINDLYFSFRSPLKWAKERLVNSAMHLFVDPPQNVVADFITSTQTKVSIKPKNFPGLSYAPTEEKLSDEEHARNLLRWNVTLPATEKMLVLSSDHDTLLTLNQAYNNLLVSTYSTQPRKRFVAKLNKGEKNQDYSDHLFKNGDHTENPLNELNQSVTEKQRERSESQLNKYLKQQLNKPLDEKCKKLVHEFMQPRLTKEYATMVVFNAIINHTLSLITDLSVIELDVMRFNNLTGLIALVENKMKQFKMTQANLAIFLINKHGLHATHAENLAHDIVEVLTYLKTGSISGNPDKQKLIDNWVMDAEIIEDMLYKAKLKRNGLPDDEYAHLRGGNVPVFATSAGPESRKHFHCHSIKADETINAKTAFTGFDRVSTPLYLEDGQANPEIPADQRAKAEAFSLENENPDSWTHYAPNPSELSVKEMDAAFKAGLIPCIIGNVKGVGFNDPNLHATVQLISTNQENVADLIQGSGRPRGLNQTKMPVYKQIDDKHIKNVFSLKSLDKKDYIPDFLKGTHIFNEQTLNEEGEKIAEAINVWVRNNINAKGELDPEALKKQVFTIFIDTLESINHNNDYELNKTRKQLTKVLEGVCTQLDFKTYRLQHRDHVTWFIKKLVSFVKSIFSMSNYLRLRKARKHLDTQAKGLAYQEPAAKQRIDLYRKIVNNSYDDCRKRSAISTAFQRLLFSEVVKMTNAFDPNSAEDNVISNHRIWLDYIHHPVFVSMLDELLNRYTPEELKLLNQHLPPEQMRNTEQLRALHQKLITGNLKNETITRNTFEDINAHVLNVINAITLEKTQLEHFHGTSEKQADDEKGNNITLLLISQPDLVKITKEYDSNKLTHQIHETFSKTKAAIQVMPETNQLHAIAAQKQIDVLKQVNQYMTKPMRAQTQLFSTGFFGGKKAPAACLQAQTAAIDFMKELKLAKPITLDEAIQGKDSALQPLRTKFAAS